MTVIGSASINIRADDKYFEADVRRAVAKIKDVRIALKVDADMSAANKKLRDLRYRISNQEIAVKIRANDAQFDADVRAAVRKVKNVQIDLKADVDVAKASKKIRDLRYRITSKDAILKVDADLAKAEEKMRKFLEKFIETEVNITAKPHTGAAHTALTDLQTRYGGNVNFTATASTKVARAALAAAARNRRVKLTPFIDSTSMAAIKGAFNVLSGTLPFDKVRESLAGVLANFEGIAVKAAALGTVLLSVSSIALTAGANILSIVGDMTQIITLSAMLPAAFIAMGSAIAANSMSWKGFADAFDEDAEKAAKALAKLPPEAQEAAKSMRGLGKEIQQATQTKFWEAMGTSLQDMVQSLLPQLKEGFEGIGASLGSFEGTAFQSIQAAFGDGVLLGILQNVATMFDNMSGGLGGFIGAIATLGRVGATYLPQFGTYLADAGNRFGEFIRQADEAGKINGWIENAVKRFNELTSVIGSTKDIMSGLTDIARMSGAPGLTQMADGFANVAAVVNSQPFQGQLLAILEGARAGTTALGEGLSTLTQLFWNSSDSVSSFLTLAGEVAGLTFENITALFDGTGLGSGLFAALTGFKEGMEAIKPAFSDMGEAIGDIGFVAGEMFVAMAPGINLLADTIKNVVDELKNGFIDALPVLNSFVQAILDIASGPIVALAGAFGDMLTTFSQLPGIVQTVIMSLGLFLLLKNKFGGFFGGISKSLKDETTNAGKTYQGLKTTSKDTAAALRQDMGRVSASMGTAMAETRAVAGQAAGKIVGTFGNMASSIRTTMAPIGKEFGSYLMNDGGMDRVKTGFNDMRYNAATNFAAASLAAKINANTMKGHFSDAATNVSNKFADMGSAAKRGLGAVGGLAGTAAGTVSNHMSNMGKSVGGYMSNMAQSIDGHLGRISPAATRAFNNMSLGASAAGSLASNHIGNMAKSIDGQLGKISPAAQRAFNTMGLNAAAAGSIAGGHISNMAQSIDGHLGRINPSAQQAFRGMGTHALAAKDVASGHISSMAQSIDGHLGRIGPAAQRAFNNMGVNAAAAGSIAGGHINSMAQSIDGHLGRISPSAQRAFNNMSLSASAGASLARDHISRMPAAMGDAATSIGNSFRDVGTRIGDSFRGATTTVRDSFNTISTHASDAAGRVGTALRPARDAFSNLATHATNMGATAGRGFGAGIGTAVSGLSDALGGGWGIAIMAATVLIGAFAQANAKTKQAVSDLTGTLDKQTGAFTAASDKMMSEDILNFEESGFGKFIQKLRGAGEDNAEILEKMGTDVAEVTKQLQNSDSSAEYIAGWENIINVLRVGHNVTDEMAKKVNLSAEALNSMDSDEVVKTGKEIIKTGENATKSATDFQKLGESMNISTIAAQKLTSNYDILKNTTSSVSEKVEALRANLDILNGGQKTATDSSKAYEQSVRDAAGAIEEIRNRAGVSIPALYDVAKGFDFASQAGADLHTALDGQAESILTTAMTAFQTAREGGAEMEAAQETAMAAMTGPLDSFRASLAALGFAPAQIDGIVASFGLVPDEIRTALMADGDQAVAEATRTKIMMDAIVAGNYQMVLSALPDEAKAALTETMDLGDAFATGNYEAILEALDKTPGGLESALLGLTSFTGEDWETELRARNLVPEEVAKANAAAQALMPEADLTIVANDLATGILDTVSNYGLDPKTLNLTGNDLVTDVLTSINNSNLMDKDSQLTVTDFVTQSVERLNATHLDGKLSTLEVDDLASAVLQDYNIMTADGKNSTLTADDLASLVLQNINDIEFDDKEVKATVFDQTYPGVASVNESIGGIGGGFSRGAMGQIDLGIGATDNTAPGVMSAQGTMETLHSVVRELQAQNATGTPTAESQATMETLQSVYRDLSANNATGGPLVASQATMNSLQNVMRDLQAQDATGGAKANAQGTMNSLQSVMRDLNANNATTGAKGAAQGTMNSLQDVSRDLRANNKAQDGVSAAQGVINSLVGRTVDVVTRFLKIGDNADGGVWTGDGTRAMAQGGIMKSAGNTAVQAFANGGVTGINRQAVKAFAGGGIENHTAQIARGAWPVRVWAEPETGGEAYIPLSKNKRKRSLDILKVVMSEFGLGHLTHSFADGGVMAGASSYATPAVVSGRYAVPVTGNSNFSNKVQSNTAPIIVQVNPSAPLNEEQVGQAAARELYWQMINN